MRRALARVSQAHRFDDRGLADLELLASELVTNAVRHGRPGTITVKIMRIPAHIRIEVTNPGRTFAPPRERNPEADGGFGLALIRRFSSRWGIEPAAGAVTVWIEYADPRAQEPAG
jgi:signal transduction histidine kinase